MKGQDIILAVIVFTVAAAIVNALGIFNSQMPGDTVNINQATISPMTNGSGTATDMDSDVSGTISILKAVSFVWTVTYTVMIGIVPLMSAYNVPIVISTPIQILIWYSIGWMLIALWQRNWR